MSSTIFLIQKAVADDTTKKANAVAQPDTVKKDLQVSHGKDTVQQKNRTDTTTTAMGDSLPATAAKPKAPEPKAEAIIIQQPVEDRQTTTTATADTAEPPLYPPYIYHIDDTAQYADIQLYNIDSLITAHDSAFYHRSLFKGHLYEPQNIATPPRTNGAPPAWVFLSIIVVSFLLGTVFSRYKGDKSDILLSPFSRLGLKNLMGDRAINKFSANLLVNFLYSVMFTLSEFFVIRHFGITLTGTPELDCLLLEGFTFVFIYSRIILVRFIGSVFNYKISTGAYVLNQSVCNLLSAMLLAPALLIAFYSGFNGEVLLYTLTAIILVMFLIRMVRGSLLMLSESQFSKIYMLYYMIVIEVVPILVVGKWISLNV